MSDAAIRVVAEASVRSAIVAGVIAVFLTVLRARAISLRQIAWTTMLVAMLLMPVLPAIVPGIAVPVPRSLTRVVSPGAEVMPALPAPPFEFQTAESTRARMDAAPSRGPAAATPPLRSGQAAAAPVSGVPRPQSPRTWPLVALVVYVIGVALLLSRALFGWLALNRIVRASTPCGRSDGVATRESNLIAAPVTVAVIAPTILLPACWRRWSDEALRAVLAHELAHIRRRDPLVRFLARLNRCLFWFHPLAWWLARTLDEIAEHASDEIAVRAIGGASDRYAGILVDLARDVQRQGGRLARLGVGMTGGLLDRRIDRLLSGDSFARPSRLRTVMVAAGCSAVIAGGAACRVVSRSVDDPIVEALERRDRTLRAQLERISIEPLADVARVDWDALPPVADLERALTQNPDDLDAMRALLLRYWIDTQPGRVPHILRLIERHPDSPLAGSVEARLSPSDLNRDRTGYPAIGGDAAAYAQAKALWLGQASRPDATATVLGNAAYFFETADKPLALTLLQRARALDPTGPWTARLGRFYAVTLGGFIAPFPGNTARAISAPEPDSAFGVVVRQTLGESKDDAVLTAAGWFLLRVGTGPFMTFDPQAWAETCFKRALQVNPRAVLAHTALLNVRRGQRRRGQPLWRVPPASAYERVAALPEAERFEELVDLPRDTYVGFEDLMRYSDDPNVKGRIDLARDQARRYAEDALTLAPKYRAHPRYGLAVYNATMTLGALALRGGDRRKASDFLRQASEASPSEELAYSVDLVSGLHWHLAGNVLELGERAAVIDFLDRMADLNVANRQLLLEIASAVRRGDHPVTLSRGQL